MNLYLDVIGIVLEPYKSAEKTNDFYVPKIAFLLHLTCHAMVVAPLVYVSVRYLEGKYTIDDWFIPEMIL